MKYKDRLLNQLYSSYQFLFYRLGANHPETKNCLHQILYVKTGG